MNRSLRVLYPYVAFLVLFLCLWASVFDDGKFKPGAPFEGGIPTYFLAKGLFCSSALFILGRVWLLLEEVRDRLPVDRRA